MILDSVLRWIVVIVPTAFGVVCAILALRPPKVEHHKRWFVSFIIAGLIGSAAVIWQQTRSASQSDDQRKELQNQISEQANRVLFQIKDLSVSFRIKIPLEHPTLRAYRERVERCAEQTLSARDYKCGTAPKTVDPENKKIRDFYISAHAELFPTQNTDLIVHTLLDHVTIDLYLFHVEPNMKQVGLRPEKADLKFQIAKTLDSPGNANPSRNTVYVALYYDIDSRSLFMQGRRVPIADGSLQTNGKITSLPDLPAALIRVEPRLSLMVITPNDRGFQLSEEFLTAYEISKGTSLEYLTVHMSNGYEFEFFEEQLGETFRDESGFPFYLTKFPR